MTRGRVLAIDRGIAIVRGERADHRVPAGDGWRAGDIVDTEGASSMGASSMGASSMGASSMGASSMGASSMGASSMGVVRAFDGDAYPEPSTEVARMPRARMHNIAARATALATVRAFFAQRDFLEVETPLLVPSPGLEIHLDAVRAGAGYLITSPEYQMKRLLAAGFERIYQVCKCFRGNERGSHHSSEFTMIEWYRAFDELDSIVRDTEELVAAVVTAISGAPIARIVDPSGTSASGTLASGTLASATSAAATSASATSASATSASATSAAATSASATSPAATSTSATSPAATSASATSPGATSASATSPAATSAGARSTSAVRVREIDVTPPWPRLTVREAMARFAGVEVYGDETAAEMVAKVRAAGIDVADGTAWDDAFFAAFLARVEPAIAAMDRPLVLEDWPAPLAALAKRKPDDPRVALRFEAYVGGIELANAFGELTDPVEQRARFVDDQRIRRERDRAVYPIDEKLLAALAEGLPPSAGIALGFDRLVMLATGAAHIDEVLAFSTAEL